MREGSNPWKGLVLGTIGGVAGVLAMDAYWKTVVTLSGNDPRERENRDGRALGSISLFGKQHRRLL